MPALMTNERNLPIRMPCQQPAGYHAFRILTVIVGPGLPAHSNASPMDVRSHHLPLNVAPPLYRSTLIPVVLQILLPVGLDQGAFVVLDRIVLLVPIVPPLVHVPDRDARVG